MRLIHVSERFDIERFEPRLPPTAAVAASSLDYSCIRMRNARP